MTRASHRKRDAQESENETPKKQERPFNPSLISLNKREVRERLYDDVREIVPRASSFGMLAGRGPQEEVDCIRWRFLRPEIVAFDLDPVAIEAAQACGIEAVQGNACYKKTFATPRKTSSCEERASDQEPSSGRERAIVREIPKRNERAVSSETTKVGERAGPPEIPSHKERRFDFFNADLCKSVTTSKRLLQNIARHTSKVMSVFVSFGKGAGGEGGEAALASEAVKRERATSPKTSIWKERAVSVEISRKCERARGGKTTEDPERAINLETPIEHEQARPNELPIWRERAAVLKTSIIRERASDQDSSTRLERASRVETPKRQERASDRKTPIVSERAKYGEAPGLHERADAHETPKVAELPDTQLGRVLLLREIVREVRPEAQIRRVYVYRGNVMMMLGVLFVFSKKAVEMLPPFCTVREEATAEREYRLASIGVAGKKLKSRLKSGQKAAKRRLPVVRRHPW